MGSSTITMLSTCKPGRAILSLLFYLSCLVALASAQYGKSALLDFFICFFTCCSTGHIVTGCPNGGAVLRIPQCTSCFFFRSALSSVSIIVPKHQIPTLLYIFWFAYLFRSCNCPVAATNAERSCTLFHVPVHIFLYLLFFALSSHPNAE